MYLWWCADVLKIVSRIGIKKKKNEFKHFKFDLILGDIGIKELNEFDNLVCF